MKRLLRLGLFAIFSLLLGLFFAFSVLSWEQANSFVFVPRTGIAQPQDPNFYDSLNFQSLDGTNLVGWYHAPSREDGASILFVHGHAANRGAFLRWADYFVEMGYGVMLFDLRAHGESEGSITTMGILESLDVQAAFYLLQSQEAVNPERIAILGHSMGAASTIIAGAELSEARAFIAISAYSSIRDALEEQIPQVIGIPPLFFPDLVVGMSSYLSGEDFYQASPITAIREIHQPILLLAGMSDDTVPYQSSERLYLAANAPKELHLIEGANHNDLYGRDFDKFTAVILPFLERYLINP